MFLNPILWADSTAASIVVNWRLPPRWACSVCLSMMSMYLLLMMSLQIVAFLSEPASKSNIKSLICIIKS